MCNDRCMALKNIMYFLLLVSIMNNVAEARVYCQDIHATSWKPLGYACTITCNTIFSAIDRLKQSDYQYLVSAHGLKTSYTANITKINEFLKTQRSQRDLNADEKYSQTYEAYRKIVPTEIFLSEFKDEVLNVTNVLNMTCFINSKRSRLLFKVLNDCSLPNMPKGYITNSFRAFLNRFADPEYRFDLPMTLIILKHLLSNVNFLYGNMVESIFMFLTRELAPYGVHTTQNKTDTIALKSKDCMSMSVSGCYCKKGYVENFGMCLKPEECSPDTMYSEYLKRIIVN